ncbi:MAG: glutamine synthetase [Candidatus Marinimicrobia bacterium]|nr:glutamine synthetase [Candidatus Neomarinimicrobiota bacterium]
MRKAHRVLKETCGYGLEVMAEIEYYVIAAKEDIYRAGDQKGYHASTPFVKWEQLRTEAMQAIVNCGGQIKYGHSEVGNFSDGDYDYEQHEIEFLPAAVEDAADQVLIAKWILRETAYRYGVTVSFAPKISTGNAGSGMHIHIRPVKNGKNMTLVKGELSDTAKKIIAGILKLAPALCAFGNTVPTSYFRLVPHQEAPTNICWGMRNRSALIRVPLGWEDTGDMSAKANPLEAARTLDTRSRQTFEFRSPDGSADIFLLIAGICVAAHYGLTMPDGEEFARKTYVDVNIFKEKYNDRQKGLAALPGSCKAAADALLAKADIFRKYGVFPNEALRGISNKLFSYKDAEIQADIRGNKEKTHKLVKKYLHCG